MQENAVLQLLAEGNTRKIAWQVEISFDKTYASTFDFFQIGVSEIDGTDKIKGTGSVVQEWDLYRYGDYTDRIVSIEITREEDKYGSLVMAYGDITLNNYDDLFSPENTDSPLYDYLLPFRPVKIWQGFGTELVQTFIGVTDRNPNIDEKAKTVSYHIVDMFGAVTDKVLDECAGVTEETTDVAIQKILNHVGVLDTQLDLDKGYNNIKRWSATPGDKAVDVLRKMMEAEQGRLLFTETGRFCFKNRQNIDPGIVMSFDAYRNIEEAIKTREDTLVNNVIIKSEIRTLQPRQRVWESTEPIIIPANSDFEVWAELPDPIYSLNIPRPGTTLSSFQVNKKEDGTGTGDENSVTLSNYYLFGKSFKMTFTNTSNASLYVLNLVLYATPYIVTDVIYINESNSDSIERYGEKQVTFDNTFFQNADEARSKAKILIDQYDDYGGVQELQIKGTPALQLGDTIFIDLYGKTQTSQISRIQMKMDKDSFDQNIQLRSYTPRSYFTVGDGGSQIAGTDYISY